MVLSGRQTWTNISFHSRFDCNLLWNVLKYKAEVPVLLKKLFVQQLECFIKNWGKANVSESNEYIFTQSNSENHFRGCDVIRKYFKECGVDSPDTIRSKYLRKPVAMISQITNLRDKKLDLLAQFIGHDIQIHCEYYCLMFCWLGDFGQTLYHAANVMALGRLAKSIQLALLAHTINMVVHSSKLIKPIRKHSFLLPIKDNRNFINCFLFKNI